MLLPSTGHSVIANNMGFLNFTKAGGAAPGQTSTLTFNKAAGNVITPEMDFRSWYQESPNLYEPRLAGASEETKPYIFQILNETNKRNLDFRLRETTRTKEEQAKKVAAGKSMTYDSMHLTGDAFDLVRFIDDKPTYKEEDYLPLQDIVQDLNIPLQQGIITKDKKSGEYGWWDRGHMQIPSEKGMYGGYQDWQKLVRPEEETPEISENVLNFGRATTIRSPEGPVFRAAPPDYKPTGLPLTTAERARATVQLIIGERPGFIEQKFGITPLRLSQHITETILLPVWKVWQTFKSTVVPLMKGERVEPLRREAAFMEMIPEEKRPQAAENIKRAVYSVIMPYIGPGVGTSIYDSLPEDVKAKLPPKSVEGALGLAELAIDLPAIIASAKSWQHLKGLVGRRMGQSAVTKLEPILRPAIGEKGMQTLVKSAEETAKRTPIWRLPRTAMAERKLPWAARPERLALPEAQITEFYAGLPIPKFKIGSTVKFGKKIGKIASIKGTKATLDIAGRIVTTDLSKLKPTEIAKPTEPKALTVANKFNTEIVSAAKKTLGPGENLEDSVARTKDWISSVLTNDQTSTNPELVDYFQKEGGFSKEIAEFIVSKRGQVRALPRGVKKEMREPAPVIKPTEFPLTLGEKPEGYKSLASRGLLEEPKAPKDHQYLYHVTSTEAYEKIKKEGLSSDSYLSEDPELAFDIASTGGRAEIILRVLAPKTHIVFDKVEGFPYVSKVIPFKNIEHINILPTGKVDVVKAVEVKPIPEPQKAQSLKDAQKIIEQAFARGVRDPRAMVQHNELAEAYKILTGKEIPKGPDALIDVDQELSALRPEIELPPAAEPEEPGEIFKTAKVLDTAYRREVLIKLKALGDIAPDIITQKQIAVAHNIAQKRRLTPRQLHRIERIVTGKGTMAVYTKGGRIRKKVMSKAEARRIINALHTILIRRGKPIQPKVRVGQLPEPAELPTEEKDALIQQEVAKSGLPFTDSETAIRLKGLDPYHLSASQQDEVIASLREVQKNPDPADRIRQFIQGKVTLKDPTLQAEQERILKHEARIRGARFAGGKKRIAKGETTASPLSQNLRLSLKQLYEDVRFSMGDLEILSGVPFYSKHYQGIAKGFSDKTQELDKAYAILSEDLVQELSIPEQENISNYFQAVYERRDLPTLTEPETRAMENIRVVMQLYKPFVKKYRFLQWVESRLAGSNKGLGFTDIPDVDQATLEEGLGVFMQPGGEQKIDAWLDTQKFGVIEKGYVPRAILGGKARFPTQKIGIFTRKMLKPRQARVDLSTIPLTKRVKTYINSILNLKYMEPHVAALDWDINALSERGHIPQDTIQKIQHWVDRVKGYHGESTGLDKILRTTQRWVHRTIVGKPRLWFRNLFQRKVTPPFKKPIFDPRLITKRFMDLPQADKDYFFSYVTQFEAMKKEYLYFLGERRTKVPVARQFVGLAEKVGETYPLTDMWNRGSVYGKTLFYIKPHMEKWLSSSKTPQDLNHLKANTGYYLMKPYEQRHFLKLLDENPAEVTRFCGKWNADNSQWLYKTTERSLEELTPQRAAIYNLFVWSKGIAQLVGNLTDKAVRGPTWPERRSGIVGIIGLVLASEMARRTINRFYGKYKVSRYEGYNILQSVLWNIGGVSVSEINETLDLAGDVIHAYTYGDEKDKRRAKGKFLKHMDGASQLMIPFYDVILSQIEAMTDAAYISPLYNAFVKKPKRIPRSMLEKIQHSFFGQVSRLEQGSPTIFQLPKTRQEREAGYQLKF